MMYQPLMIFPRPNTELDVGTTMFTNNATPSSTGIANDTLFINNIKSSSGNSPVTRNPFDIRRLMENRPPLSEVASEDGEPWHPLKGNPCGTTKESPCIQDSSENCCRRGIDV